MQRKLQLVIGVLVALLVLAACGEDPAKTDNEIQRDVQERVRTQGPIHEPNYSRTYDAINAWLERWDSPDKISYVYLLGDTGNVIGYYTAQGRPVNICTFLTAPYEIVPREGTDLVVPAPALDGVYYGNDSCDSWYFFTADTDAYIEIGGGMRFFVTDQPLAVEAEEITVETTE